MTSNTASDETPVDSEAPTLPPQPTTEPKPPKRVVQPDGGWEPNTPPTD